MNVVTRDQIIEILKHLGIQVGDGLLIHSALQYLGRPISGENSSSLFFNALSHCLDMDSSLDNGTLVVPAFNFSFAKGLPYDPQSTPSQGMGIFSEYLRQQLAARRSPHPMQSFAVLGAYSADLVSRDPLSAFDQGSASERMLDLNFKLLLLGTDIQAVSMIHYCEQRAEVPYRFWKDFSGQVKNANTGVWENRTYRMFVRDLDIDPKLSLYPLQDVLENRGLWFSERLNYGYISTCYLKDLVAVGDELLAADPWVFVKNRGKD